MLKKISPRTIAIGGGVLIVLFLTGGLLSPGGSSRMLVIALAFVLAIYPYLELHKIRKNSDRTVELLEEILEKRRF